MAKSRLQIIPLGGLGEVGKNMTVFRYGDEIIVIDAGMAFPDETMPGVDIVIPDFSYLIENRDKIKAILITHGHEDHIGSLAYLLRDVSAPVYATRLTCGLIEGKLKEQKIGKYNLNVVKTGDEFRRGSFRFGFFHVCHSIPDSCGVYVRTPVGTVVHTGDFKFDHSPVDGEQTDMHKLAELGRNGVLVLCADSTNAQNPGYTLSEAVVSKSLRDAFHEVRGRIILATFASNVSRVQMAIDAAVENKRKVCVFGRSMVNVVGIALEMGYLKAPEGTCMADGSHRQVQIHAGDTVIISASPIPGNETSVGRTIDNLMRLGAKVITSRTSRVHVSGHGSQEDLKTMLSLVRPKFFVPVHGEYRMLRSHAELAESLGVPKQNILIGDNGTVFEFTNRSGKINGKVQSGAVFVDGLGVGDVGNIVIRDRQQLAQDGVFIVVIALEKGSSQVAAGPDIVSRGFVYVRDSEELMSGARSRIENVLERCNTGNVTEWNAIKTQIRDALGRYFFEKTKRRPMILPIIQEVR